MKKIAALSVLILLIYAQNAIANEEMVFVHEETVKLADSEEKVLASKGNTLDASRLTEAQSLKEMFDLARKKGPRSKANIVAFSKIVTEHLQGCCSQKDKLFDELNDAGFVETRDVTVRVRARPREYPLQPSTFDQVIYSKQKAGLQFFGLLPTSTEYVIYMYLHGEKVQSVTAIINWHELF